MVLFWLKVRLFMYLIGVPAIVVVILLVREWLERAWHNRRHGNNGTKSPQ